MEISIQELFKINAEALRVQREEFETRLQAAEAVVRAAEAVDWEAIDVNLDTAGIYNPAYTTFKEALRAARGEE